MHVLSGENHGYDDNVALIVDADYKILDHDDDIVDLMQQFTAQEINPSIVENFDDDEEVEYYDEINPVVIKAWKSVYPDVPLKVIDDEDMYMQYTTADEYEHHGGNGKDFYLSLGVQYIGYEEPPMGYVNVGDAYAGNYKGVIAKIIASLFEWLEQRHPNMGVKELGIHMNRNAEAWDAIAKKVGAQIEQRGYYENFADGKKKGKSIDEGPGDFDDMKLDAKGKQDSLDYFYYTHAPSMGKPTKAGSFKGHSIVTFKTPHGMLMFLVNQNDQPVFYVGLNKMPDGVAVGNVRSNSTIKATEVYRYLVSKYGKLYSDKGQTTDGKKIWSNLAKYNPELKIADVGDRLVATENFADGKVKGKSRPGRVKRAGASCKGSVSSLRAKAKKYSGERGKMYHWCANMKGGKKKKNESLLVSTFDNEFVKKAKELYNAGQQGQLIRHIYKFSKENAERIHEKPELKQMLQDIFYEVSDNFQDEDQIEELLFIIDNTLSNPVNESAFENLKLPTWMSHTSLEKLFAQEYGPRYGDYVAHMELDSDDDLAMNASGMGDMAFELVKANDIKVMQKFLSQMPVQFTVDDLKLNKGIQVWHLVQQNKTVH
jgi:hypothetical protein